MTRPRTDAIHHHVVVNAPIERAFAVFTTRFGDFKPREHNLLAIPITETVFECHAGGHIYDRGVDGSVCKWARVLVYERPAGCYSRGISARLGGRKPIWPRPVRSKSASPRSPPRRHASTSNIAISTDTVRAGSRSPTALTARPDGRYTYAAIPTCSASRCSHDRGRRRYREVHDGHGPRRAAELAAFLTTLTLQQWETPSLCAGWSVKEVVAHMISYEDLGVFGLLKRFAKGRIVRANEVGVDEFAGLSPQELADYVGRHLQPRGLTAGFGGMIALVDGMIHHQDIRRPLGQPRTIPAQRLDRVLRLMPKNPRLRARPRIKGLRLRATDLDWTIGTGPEVTGPGEALLMAMAGRPAAVSDLSGPGKPTLAGRLG